VASLPAILIISHEHPAIDPRVQSRDRQTSADFFRGCVSSVAPCHRVLIILSVPAAWINAERYPSHTTVMVFIDDLCLQAILLANGADLCPKTAGARMSPIASRACTHPGQTWSRLPRSSSLLVRWARHGCGLMGDDGVGTPPTDHGPADSRASYCRRGGEPCRSRPSGA
jgi:hypothetical protein